ncbi:DUF1330 domain-containing protein [Acidicapsa ligni]|uniref:DUF1330 domain-containing protein n=1 Tax=Acidicapsa ligni TaxID=542300 RepID=UPI0021E07438|nr:DUF1330 domain-containing protein [Acidicapsa ligni]
MSAYIVITREKTRDTAKLEEYKKLSAPTFEEFPVTVRAIHGRHEVLEGAATEDIIILEFASYEEAKTWYHSPVYQAACESRFQGGDYRFILTEGSPAK